MIPYWPRLFAKCVTGTVRRWDNPVESLPFERQREHSARTDAPCHQQELEQNCPTAPPAPVATSAGELLCLGYPEAN